ncbi:GspE/PulE family protein [Roseivivax lentus]|nr:GspE/PulE family protein [Roseivivax lentus]
MRVSYGFAQAEQVAHDGTRLLIGPEATSFGLREMLRRFPTPTPPAHLDEKAFASAIAKLYGNSGDEDAVLFDLGDADEAALQQRDLLDDPSDAPVIRLVNQLLKKAVQRGASDLHFEPYEGGLRVRARIDGFLLPIYDEADVPLARVVSRLKVMSGLDIAETRLPQDGRVGLRVGGRKIDTRVSTLPSSYGERVVLRILDRDANLMPLEALGISDRHVRILERLAARPDGIILATGPTGSGKTTTLYSLLKLANRDERNLITVEDPVEFNLDGLNQTQINADIGMTFAAGLRAALRQDPDVILVGEIRDQETASIAGQAALTGHLVFSSLHTNSAVGAVIRLRDLGIEDYLISATVRGVIAQRLLRNLCDDCKEAHSPTPEHVALFAAEDIAPPDVLFRAKGCESCGGAGYRGRIGIYDLVEIDDAVRAAIDRAAPEAELRDLTGGSGLMREALGKVASGVTDLAEVERVLGTGR